LTTPNIPDIGEYRDARGRAPVDPAIFKQPHSLILGCAGQSMLANFAQVTRYDPWTGGVYELDTITGNIYQVTDGSFPTMGMNGWDGRVSVLPYWADMLCAQGRAERVLLAAHNVGGTTAQQWCPIGNLYQRSLGTLQWLQGLGIPPNFWIEMQGQGEFNPNDPTVCTDAANYANLRKWKIQALQAAGLYCTVVIGQGAHWTGYSDVQTARYAEIKKGQVMASQGVPLICLGPDDDEWPDAGYRVDGVHPADGMRYWQMQRWLPCFPNF
jgi:hypothetical protein